MIQNISISGIKFELDEATSKYVTKKIGGLDRFLPRHARKSATAEVKLKEVNLSHGNKYEVDVTLHLPEKTITAKDSTTNIMAATDIVELKLANQLRKYKETHLAHLGKSRALLSRFKRSYARDAA